MPDKRGHRHGAGGSSVASDAGSKALVPRDAGVALAASGMDPGTLVRRSARGSSAACGMDPRALARMEPGSQPPDIYPPASSYHAGSEFPMGHDPGFAPGHMTPRGPYGHAGSGHVPRYAESPPPTYNYLGNETRYAVTPTPGYMPGYDESSLELSMYPHDMYAQETAGGIHSMGTPMGMPVHVPIPVPVAVPVMHPMYMHPDDLDDPLLPGDGTYAEYRDVGRSHGSRTPERSRERSPHRRQGNRRGDVTVYIYDGKGRRGKKERDRYGSDSENSEDSEDIVIPLRGLGVRDDYHSRSSDSGSRRRPESSSRRNSESQSRRSRRDRVRDYKETHLNLSSNELTLPAETLKRQLDGKWNSVLGIMATFEQPARLGFWNVR